ncbi:hypothetical protein, partial [Marinifilum sp. D737]|uniref:hypothetical protein n=1 Tax=Marinifilum sp. D737 TaxID=2969628 RepID=UPI002275CAC0
VADTYRITSLLNHEFTKSRIHSIIQSKSRKVQVSRRSSQVLSRFLQNRPSVAGTYLITSSLNHT